MDDGSHLKYDLKIDCLVSESSKTYENVNSSGSCDSPRSCSLGSEYELVSDINADGSEYEECCSEMEGNIVENHDVKEINCSENFKHIEGDKLSDTSSVMDEVYVILDDDANEKSDSQGSLYDAKHILSDDDFEMDKIIAEFAVEENKTKCVVKLSDNEDEIDSLLGEFVETQVNESKSNTKVILSSEGEDEMDGLLEEFCKENVLDNGFKLNEINTNAFDSTDICENASDALNNKSDKSTTSGFHIVESEKNMLPTSVVLEVASESINDINSDENYCVIVCDSDDKSDCSSIEVLDDITEIKETYVQINDTQKDNSNEHCTNKKNISSNVINSQMIEDMIVVDEAQDNSDTDISKLISGSESFQSQDKSRLSGSSENRTISISSENNVANEILITPSANAFHKKDLVEKPLINGNDPKETNEKDDELDFDFSAVADEFSNSSDAVEPLSSKSVLAQVNEKIDNNDLDFSAVINELSNSSNISRDKSSKLNSGTNETNSDKNPKFTKLTDISENASKSHCVLSNNPNISDNSCSLDQEIKSSEKEIVSDQKIQMEILSEHKKDVDISDVDSQSLNSVITEHSSDGVKKAKTDECIANDIKVDIPVSILNTDSSRVSFPGETSNDSNENRDICENSAVELDNNMENNSKQMEKINNVLKDIIDNIEKNNSILDKDTDITGDNSVVENFANPSKTIPETSVKNTELQLDADAVYDSNENKKRKLEDVPGKIDTKKQKTDNNENTVLNLLNGRESPSCNISNDFTLQNTKIEDDVTVAECTILDKASQFLPVKLFDKFQTTEKVLDAISLHLCREVVKECFKNSCDKAENQITELKTKYERLCSNLENFRRQANEFNNSQRRSFIEHGFKPKAHTRTVGVNVKIYRESELKQALSRKNEEVEDIGKHLTYNLEAVSSNQACKQEINANFQKITCVSPKAATNQNTTLVFKDEDKDTKVFQNNTPTTMMKDSFLPPISQQQVKRQLLPRIITQTNRPLLSTNGVTGITSKAPPPPNVTVCGNRLIPFAPPQKPGIPSTHSVVLVPSSSITAPTRNNQYVDLTKEEHKMNPPLGVSTPTTTVAKVTVPGMPNASRVFLPIRNYLHIVPGSRAPIQSPQVSRPTLMPPLSTSVLGRAVTYIMPTNSGVGPRGIHPILPSPHQQLRLFFQVTNTGNVPALGTVVNSVARMSGIPSQPVRSSPPRMAGMSLLQNSTSTPRMSLSQPSPKTSPQSGGLVLYSTTSKHPAPFPKSNEYPDIKGKAIPPKPSLKGNRNTNGIVLSWNMNLFKHHEDISSYQLFAYQETDGPVDASLWKKVGDVQALPLPMACTLTQFTDKNRYYFTVRAIDILKRCGPFSDPVSIFYDKDSEVLKK